MSTSTNTTSVRIPSDLLDRCDRLAGTTERTRSYHVVKALAAYIAEQEYLQGLFLEATADADADPAAVPNAEAAIAAGILRPEDLAGPDPVGDEEYAATQEQATGWR